jgi:hypothetical protein
MLPRDTTVNDLFAESSGEVLMPAFDPELDSFTEVEESTWCRLCHVVIDDGERGWDAYLAAKHRCPYCEIDLDGKGDYRRHLANAHALERPN